LRRRGLFGLGVGFVVGFGAAGEVVAWLRFVFVVVVVWRRRVGGAVVGLMVGEVWVVRAG
jgi:hypothetical protein